MVRTLLLSCFLAAPLISNACSCFGPQTFCGTLDPPYANPEWWVPDAVVLGVKQADFQHGMDVEVVQSFSGQLQVGETVRVWGDCGLLCRHYPGTWAVGDTVVWALRVTDLSGNALCGTNYEVPTDYMISICGVYYLDYENGEVSGPIITEMGETMSLTQFMGMMEGCLAMGIEEENSDGLQVFDNGNAPTIALPQLEGTARLRATDAQGRVLLDQAWNGKPLALDGLTAGMYMVQAQSGNRRWTVRVLRR